MGATLVWALKDTRRDEPTGVPRSDRGGTTELVSTEPSTVGRYRVPIVARAPFPLTAYTALPEVRIPYATEHG